MPGDLPSEQSRYTKALLQLPRFSFYSVISSQMRIAARIAIAVVVLYAVAVTGIFIAMHQPIDQFTRVMAHVPGPLFIILPFEPMWLSARGGHLRVGDPAPDFSLETYDHKSRVQLSTARANEPVVLVFGSYT
jgi:hypothetical protein